MAKGGLTGMYNFRKIHSKTAIISKYTSIVKTAEDLENEKLNKVEHMESESDEEVQVAQSSAKKNYTIDDIMLDSKLSISKKKPAAVIVNAKKSNQKEKKKVFSKKSKKIIKFWFLCN